MTHRRRWLILFVVIQVLILAGITASWYAIDIWGKEIQLKTVPIDPRDLLYGDYVALDYEVSDVPASLWKGEPNEWKGSPTSVYVRLTLKGERWTVRTVSEDQPESTGGDVVLRAKASDTYSGTIHLDYGLERYYVPEGAGRTLEQTRKPLLVTVKTSPWGQAKIVSLKRE
ncbi:GDYXXLXY domain-containing protein [Salinithrix halophila]|uniref:GDYXXLXY domain-containing protein n=1 Tax=Salinithrix halophila TaxID=1485204 RepID=A0ABV8JBN7_9BACL